MNMDLTVLHQGLLREVSEISEFLQRELEEDSEMTKARENNYHLLHLMLEEPTLSPRDYDNILFSKYGIDRSLEVHGQLRVSNLYSVEKRQRIGRIMKEISQSTYRLLTGRSTDILKDFDDIARIVRSSFFYERRVEGKIYLIALTSLSSWKDIEHNAYLRSSLATLEAVSKKGSYKLCRETARSLVDVIGTEYGLEKRKTSTERMQDTLADVTTMQDKDDILAALRIAQIRSQHLKEQFEKEVQNRNREFIRDFFARMNSVRQSELLDSIAQTDFLIQKLQEQGWKIKPELQAVPMIIQVLMNFLRNEGIVPIETIGQVRELTGSELSNYEFVGARSPRLEDQVKVVIKTPGWRFDDMIISLPRAEEASA